MGIGTDAPDASAALDINSTTSGLLIPRMTDQQRLDITEPASGLMVYVTDFGGGTFMFYEGDATTTNWISLSSVAQIPTYSVNAFYAELGGYVIEVNSDGTYGIVVAMQDQGSSTWYHANNIVNSPACHDSDGAKFKNWRLSNNRELNLMYHVYLVRNEANLNLNIHWNSKENDYHSAYCHDFDYEYTYYLNQNKNTQITFVQFVLFSYLSI